MSHNYHEAQRLLQDRFDTRRLADRLGEAMSETVGDSYASFIEACDMFFIATADATGSPECSYKGGSPGFVRVLDESTLAFPVYDGNGMFLSLGNIVVNPQVGLLFIDFATGTRLRVNGEASMDHDDALIASYPGAQAVVRIRVRDAFANCRRYVHRYERVEASEFVPDGVTTPPVPDWKRDPWFDGTLAATDPAHDPENPSAPAIPRF